MNRPGNPSRNLRVFAGLCTCILLATTALVLPLGMGSSAKASPIGDAPLPVCKRGVTPATPLNDVLEPVVMYDYGDAPDDTNFAPMPTTYFGGGAPIGTFPTVGPTVNSYIPSAPGFQGAPGARHRIVDVGWLGNNAVYAPNPLGLPQVLAIGDLPPTLERDADLFPDADLVQTNLVATPDHDGRDDGLVGATLPPFGAGTLQFRVSSTTGIQNWFVNILIDWDFSGHWVGNDPGSGAAEWVVVNMPVSVAAGTSQLFTTPPFPTGSTFGTPWVRITLSNEPVDVKQFVGIGGWDGSVPKGQFDFQGLWAFACGETEDYCGLVSLGEGLPGERGIVCRKDSQIG